MEALPGSKAGNPVAPNNFSVSLSEGISAIAIADMKQYIRSSLLLTEKKNPISSEALEACMGGKGENVFQYFPNTTYHHKC